MENPNNPLFERLEALLPKIEQFLQDIYETESLDPSEMAIMFHNLSYRFTQQALQDTGLSKEALKEMEKLAFEKAEHERKSGKGLSELIVDSHTTHLTTLLFFDSILKSIHKEV